MFGPLLGMKTSDDVGVVCGKKMPRSFKQGSGWGKPWFSVLALLRECTLHSVIYNRVFIIEFCHVLHFTDFPTNGSDCPNADPQSMRGVNLNCVSSGQPPPGGITAYFGDYRYLSPVTTREMVWIHLPRGLFLLAYTRARAAVFSPAWASSLMEDRGSAP